MTPSSRDRISVDLQGLKAALMARAQTLGVRPSELIRGVLADALGRSAPAVIGGPPQRCAPRSSNRTRLCLRMGRDEAATTLAAARRAGMSAGDYVAGLVAGVPAIEAGSRPADHVAALVASCAELSTLSRNIHHLTILLRQGEFGPARAYREMLDTLSGDIRSHLVQASGLLADLRPRGRPTGPAQQPKL
jgi:hypothetical protein